MPDQPTRGLELVELYAAKLEEDLAYAAPEMWPVHIRRRMEELADDLAAEDEPTDA